MNKVYVAGAKALLLAAIVILSVVGVTSQAFAQRATNEGASNEAKEKRQGANRFPWKRRHVKPLQRNPYTHYGPRKPYRPKPDLAHKRKPHEKDRSKRPNWRDDDDRDDDARPYRRKIHRLPPRHAPLGPMRPRFPDYDEDFDDDDDDDRFYAGDDDNPNTGKPPRDGDDQANRLTIIPPLPTLSPKRAPPVQAALTAAPPPMPLSRTGAFNERPRYKPSEVVVMVHSDNPDGVAFRLAQSHNLVLLENWQVALLDQTRMFRFRIPDDRAVPDVAARLSGEPGVGKAIPNNYYWLQGEPGGTVRDLQYALPKMRVAAAQKLANGSGMIIAVIDSGVDASHPALKNTRLTVIDAMEEGVPGPDAHGTAITGIIAANGDMTGIAPSANIIAVRAFASERPGSPPVTTVAALCRAIDEAFQKGARIFNMSFAGEREPMLIAMIDAAYARGAVFVAAAGNQGPGAPPAFPAAHDKVIAVTATDADDALYERANRGGYVLAAAPGVDILAPVTGQGFDYLSGTSFAAAHVTGVIALLMEKNPKLTADKIRAALVGAAHDLGPTGLDADFGAGLTDAYGSLLLVDGRQAGKQAVQ